MKRYNNYHKHDHVSSIFTPDSNEHQEAYVKKTVEYKHTTYFTTNHGSMGDIFEARTLCDKYGIRCVAGIEGYIVPNPLEKDKSNYHIIIIPRTDEARKKVNYISSRANVEGFYYKPRIFLEDLLALSPDDVYITTACCAGLLKDEVSIEKILYPLYSHFGKSVFLEVQNHNVEIQKEINRKAISLAEELGLELIAANDSHYVDAVTGKKERAELLKGKHIDYGDEDEFILDFPDYDTMFARFQKQGVLTDEQITRAIDNTLIFDDCEEIKLDTSIKMPTIYPELSLDERMELLEKEISKRFKKIIIDDEITAEELPKYKDGIEYELKAIRETNKEIRTADYFLFNEKNVDLAVNKYGGVLTRGGRGSAGSFYINRILGMTQLDRFRINLPIFPDRFMSAARLLENRALPDFDFNVEAQEPFVKASRELLGEHGCYPMIAYGTMQLAEAFRNVCRSKGLEYEGFNEVSKNIEKYLEDKQWKPYIDEAKKYVGTIVSASVHPCAHILANEDLRYEYGVVRMGDAICVMITSAEADEYKVLKNDYLIVTVWKLINETFKTIGQPIIPASQLLKNIKNDERIWDLFRKGLTCTLNQVDSDNGMRQAKRYGISSFEDGAFIAAAIRPSFDSWREQFLSRTPYSTGSKDLDDVLSMTDHYILFQENLMQYFQWLGVSPAESIGLIKKISKKKIHPEDFANLETRLRTKWIENTGSEDKFDDTWKMIQSCISYGFCSAHAASTSLDMCYGAYLKVNYPLEYYTVCFNNYKNDETRTRKLTDEIKQFGIVLCPIRFGYSRADYSFDRETNSIYKGVASVKYINDTIPEELYALKGRYTNFVDLLYAMDKETSINSAQLDILIKLDFFADFGDLNTLLFIVFMYRKLMRRKSWKKDELETLCISEGIMRKFSKSETETRVDEIDAVAYVTDLGVENPEKALADCVKYKYPKDDNGDKSKIPNGYSMKKVIKKYPSSEEFVNQHATKTVIGVFSDIDKRGLLKYLMANSKADKCTLAQKLRYQTELLGGITYIDSTLDKRYVVVMGLDTTYSPKFRAYCLATGQTVEMKVYKNLNFKDKSIKASYKTNPFQNGDIIYMITPKKREKVKKVGDRWIGTGQFEWWLLNYEVKDEGSI